MGISFSDSSDSIHIAPRGRFSAPTPDQVFKYWRLAPGPCYSICLVKITDIGPNREISVNFLNKDGTVINKEFRLELDDLDSVWPHFPSTIETPAAMGQVNDTLGDLPDNVGQLGNNNYAVLCVANSILKQAADDGTIIPQFGKHPYAEDAIPLYQQAIQELKQKLQDAGLPLHGIPGLDLLHHNGLDL